VFRRTAASAAGALLLLGAVSWLPAHASGAHAATHAAPDLARPALLPPETQPAAAPGPVPAVSGFFWALSAAVAGRGAAGAAPAAAKPATAAPPGRSSAAPTEPEGARPAPPATEAFAHAYAYLAPTWRSALPFAAFVEGWAQTRTLDLLAVLPAGPPLGDPRAERVFVEVRTLTDIGGGAPHVVLGYASGFYTAEPSPKGWQLRGGGLSPETFGLGRGEAPGGAAQVAAAAARTIARGLGRPGAGAAPAVEVTAGKDNRASAAVRLGEDLYTVSLYELVDGQWVAVRVTR